MKKTYIKINLGLPYCLFAFLTAMIGYNVNHHLGSNHCLFWAICDFFLSPLAWIKWIICEQVNLSIIRETFAFFFK